MSESKNLYQRLLAIQTELGVVAKNLQIQTSATSGYKAVSERDVIDAIKPLEAKYGVYSYPVEREVILAETLENERLLKDGSKTKVTSKFMRLAVTYRFVNVDDPKEYIEVPTYGDGIDTGDKAPGKAITYADKYALMKAYKISTGDDPDQEKSPDNGYRVTNTESPEERKATAKQLAFIKAHYYVDEIEKDFGKKVDELTLKEASEIIKGAKR